MHLRRLLFIATILLLTPLGLKAQGGTTFVSGQILDPSGNKYVNSQVNISFFDPGTSGKLPLLSGSTFQTQYTYQTDSFGNLPNIVLIALPDNGAIAASSGATGTQWIFRVVYQDRVTSFTTTLTINCSLNLPATCTGNTINLTAALQAAAAPLPGSALGNISTGNITTTGNHTISGTLGVTGATTLTGALNANGGGALNGNFSGPTTLTNVVAETANNINKVIYGTGYGMVCDGVTNDTTALTNAIAAGGKNAHIILPPSTNPCMVNIESGAINVYDGSWISGAGKFGTTIKRLNSGSANNSIFAVASGGSFGTTGNVLFTDFTIDGNQGNQTGGGDLINGPAVTKFTLLRMRLINSWNNGVGFFEAGVTAVTDSLFADNDFESNGVRAGCAGLSVCQDLRIGQVLRVRIERNRSDSAQNFILFLSNTGLGQFNVSENIVNNCLGFAVAFGGGTIGASNGNVTRNNFNCPTSTQNIIDLAYWTDIVVSDNTIVMGSGPFGIGDLPPALRVTVTSNRVIGSAASATGNFDCIGLGGSDLTITGNICTGAGGAGIVIPVANTGPAKRIVISGNIVKNCSLFSSGSHAGIEFFLQAGGTAALANVIVKGNHAYDDQGTPTQGYGIGIALSGQASGYSNFTIEGNDLRGNKFAAINNAATPISGFSVHGNPGIDTAPIDFTAQTAAVGSTFLYNVPIGLNQNVRVCWSAKVTTAATTSSTLGGASGFQLIYTDADDSVSTTTPAAGAPSAGVNQAYSQTNQGNTTSSQASGCLLVNAKANTNINFQFGYTSAGATPMAYSLHVREDTF
jgi:hypothetical protein